jgi:hypothetical protein
MVLLMHDGILSSRCAVPASGGPASRSARYTAAAGMSRDRAADLRLVAAVLVAVLLFAPGVRDAGRVDREGPVSRDVLVRSLALPGDRAVIELGRRSSLVETLLTHRPMAGRAWVAVLLVSLALVGAEGRWPVRHQPSRPLYILLRRAARRRAPPCFPSG